MVHVSHRTRTMQIRPMARDSVAEKVRAIQERKGKERKLKRQIEQEFGVQKTTKAKVKYRRRLEHAGTTLPIVKNGKLLFDIKISTKKSRQRGTVRHELTEAVLRKRIWDLADKKWQKALGEDLVAVLEPNEALMFETTSYSQQFEEPSRFRTKAIKFMRKHATKKTTVESLCSLLPPNLDLPHKLAVIGAVAIFDAAPNSKGNRRKIRKYLVENPKIMERLDFNQKYLGLVAFFRKIAEGRIK